MTTDQAVEETRPEPTEASTETIQRRLPVPDVVMIDGLRNELGRSNDENVRLRIELEYANQLIASLQGTLMDALSHEHTHEEGQGHVHVHEEFEH
jgi:hypothetical protein